LQFCRGTAVPGAGKRLIATLAANVVLLTLVCWVYSHLKAGVLLGENVDAWLYEFDLWLCQGAEPWTLAREWMPTWCAGPLYVIYMAFLPVLLAAVLLLAMYGRKSAAAELMCALLLGYNLGGLAYHVLPSYGPAFVVESADPSELSPGVASVQRLILACVHAVQANPGQAEIYPWTYVGAFPSLHFSHVLIAAWYLRRQRWAFAGMSLFAVLTAVSTVYFGWHYVADWFGGLMVAVAAVGLTELWSWSRRRSGAGEATSTEAMLPLPRILLPQLAAWLSATRGAALAEQDSPVSAKLFADDLAPELVSTRLS
jgi:membrane-associated phospholipid phosphatase